MSTGALNWFLVFKPKRLNGTIVLPTQGLFRRLALRAVETNGQSRHCLWLRCEAVCSHPCSLLAALSVVFHLAIVIVYAYHNQTYYWVRRLHRNPRYLPS